MKRALLSVLVAVVAVPVFAVAESKKPAAAPAPLDNPNRAVMPQKEAHPHGGAPGQMKKKAETAMGADAGTELQVTTQTAQGTTAADAGTGTTTPAPAPAAAPAPKAKGKSGQGM